MISIAILDDEKMYLEKERQITEAYFARKNIPCKIEIFQDADWMTAGLEEERYDIYILDIEMPRKNGLDVARELRQVYPDPTIIFITNFVDYAIEAYEVNTWRYIPKAALEEKLLEAYDGLLPVLLAREEKFYIIEKKSEMEKIFYDDMYYMKKDGRYTVITHRYGESRVRKSLADVFAELNSSEFLFIDKGYIVNIRNVMGMKEHMVRMRDGTRLPVGAPRVSQVRNTIAEYWRC